MSEQLVPDNGCITSLFGRQILQLGTRIRKRYLRNALEYWRTTGFPYERLTKDEVTAQFHSVARSPLTDLSDGHTIGSSSVGLRLANSYHPQMWHATSHRHRRSPIDYFHDDGHLQAMLERAPRFWRDKRCWSPQAVRNLARIYSGGRVANFRPVVARNIINCWSRPGDLVLDFSAGYGGRLLACLTLDRRYVGIDPARKQVNGLKKMTHDLQMHSKASSLITKGCAEEVLAEMETATVDLVFSSPPYFNLEVYSRETTQSACRYTTYTEWRARFLSVVLDHSRRVLKRNGYLAINVSSCPRCPLATDALDIASRLLEYACTVYIEMPARPVQRSRNNSARRLEPIYIFQKR